MFFFCFNEKTKKKFCIKNAPNPRHRFFFNFVFLELFSLFFILPPVRREERKNKTKKHKPERPTVCLFSPSFSKKEKKIYTYIVVKYHHCPLTIIKVKKRKTSRFYTTELSIYFYRFFFLYIFSHHALNFTI